MPLSYFKRPMALITIAYVCVLAALRACGVFRLETSEAGADWVREPCVHLEGRVVSGLTENRIGRRVRVRAIAITGECGWEAAEGAPPTTPGRERRSPYRPVRRDDHRAAFLGDSCPRMLFPRAEEFSAWRNGRSLEVMMYLPKDGRAADRALSRGSAASEVRWGAAAAEELWPGDEVAFEGRMRLPRWPRNPGEFDEKEFMSDMGLSFVFYARRVRVLNAGVPLAWLPMRWAERIHRSIHRVLVESYSQEVAGLLEGMLLGYKGLLETQTHRAIQDAGVMHLLVPSGAKVAFVTAFILWLAMYLGVRPALRWLWASIVSGFYVLIVGADPPYIRSYLGALILGGAPFWERETQGFQALILSAFVVLALHPRDLFSVGFQMSYLVVLGVLIAMPRWRFANHYPWIFRWAIQALLVSFIAQLMLVPLLARTFGRVSCVGVLANAILVPSSVVVFATGFALWTLSFCPFPSMFQGLSQGLGEMARVFQWICARFASIPGAAFDAAPFRWWEVVEYYLLVFGVLVLPRWRASCGAWSVAAALVLTIRIFSEAAGPNLRMIFLSQHGHRSAVVQWPKGKNILVGAGAAPSATARSLHALGIRKLDAVYVLDDERGVRRSRAIGNLVPVKEWRVESSTVPLQVRFGEFLARFEPASGISVVGVGEPGSECCIIQTLPKDAPEDGLPQCRFDTGRDGAVWVTSDGRRYHVTSQKRLHALGDSVP